MGANLDDEEAPHPYIESLIVREFSQMASNWRSSETAQLYLNRHKIPVIWDIDTRALVRHIRNVGALRGVVATDGTAAEQLIHEAKNLPKMAGQELASRVSCQKAYAWDKGSIELASAPWTEQARFQRGEPRRPALPRGGLRLRHQAEYFAHAHRSPLRSAGGSRADSAEDVLGLGPDGIFLSNGPGDPEPVEYAVNNIRKLIGKVPVFGICLGHQLCGLALGGKTFKLKFGHHGSNHPVHNLLTQKVEITAQNHGFCVDPESLPSSDVEITHVNLNDHTNEGMRHKSLPLFSVQYHPEASPGPHDSHYLFTQFTELMKETRR